MEKIEKYINAIQDDINNNRLDEADTEYLMNIVRGIGYLKLRRNFSIPEGLKSRVANFLKLEIPAEKNASSRVGPSLTDLRDIEETREIAILMNNLVAGNRRISWTTEEEVWEEFWTELKNIGANALLSALDIEAVQLGYQEFAGSFSQSWQKEWSAFSSFRKKYLDELQENSHYFYRMASEVKNLLVEYFYLPEGRLKNILKEIAAVRIEEITANDFRRVFKAEEVHEFYNFTNKKFVNEPLAKQIYLSETAFAVETISEFLYVAIMATGGIKKFDIKSNLTAKNREIPIPAIKAGDKIYGVIMNVEEIERWGIDKGMVAQKIFSETNEAFDGCIFCSWKGYQSGAVLVRMDSYWDKEQYLKLTKSSSKNFFWVTPEKILEHDQRMTFFQKVAAASAK